MAIASTSLSYFMIDRDTSRVLNRNLRLTKATYLADLSYFMIDKDISRVFNINLYPW